MDSNKKIKIELEERLKPLLRSKGMNWSCLAQKPFEFAPTTFTATIEGLKPKTFNRAKQEQMLKQFLDNPDAAALYGISSAPNDGMSKLMAAWMMEYHYKHVKDARPVWRDVMGGFDSDLMQDDVQATMLVLNNVGPDSSQTKKEKLRDILEKYADLPKIVVVNGSDAFTFMTLHMRLPMSGVCYLTNGLIKKAIEV